MFDIGFAELILIAIVGLLVIGPDQLPGTIRTIALWIGRIKRSFNEIKQDIEREVGADEIRRELHNEKVLSDIERSQRAFDDIKNDVENSIAGRDWASKPESSDPAENVSADTTADNAADPVANQAEKPEQQ
jgi:sec-independent protein translocase protein TatB